MFEKKTFVLNCEVCDTRKMTAESLILRIGKTSFLIFPIPGVMW